jgi:hypothetical protein
MGLRLPSTAYTQRSRRPETLGWLQPLRGKKPGRVLISMLIY